MYQTDALEILLVLTRLGREGEVAGAAADGADGTPILGDERLREALDLVASRADAQGRWKLQQTFNDRFVVPIEAKGEPSRWVTLRALRGTPGELTARPSSAFVLSVRRGGRSATAPVAADRR